VAMIEHMTELEFGKDRRYMRREGNILIRKRRTRKGILKVFLSILLFASIIGAVSFVLKEGYLYLISSSEYDVRSVKITGCKRTSEEELKTSVSFVLRRNIFTIDLEELKKALKEKNRWVENASMKKILPSEIEIGITEREPVALFLLHDTIRLVDGKAVPIDEMRPEYASFDLPILTGIEAKTDEDSVLKLKQGIGIIEEIGQNRPSMIDLISEINCSEEDFVKVILNDGSPVIYLDSETLAENIDNYLHIKDDIALLFDRIEYIDLRWKNRVVVKPLSYVR